MTSAERRAARPKPTRVEKRAAAEAHNAEMRARAERRTQVVRTLPGGGRGALWLMAAVAAMGPP